MVRVSKKAVYPALCIVGISLSLMVLQLGTSGYLEGRRSLVPLGMYDLYHSATANLAKRSYKTNTLTRFGTRVKFNNHTCPPGSLASDPGKMHTRSEHSDDCPTAFIIGARKGGTTSLYQYLSQHPDFTGVNLDKGPKAGETMFFQRNRWDWDAYRSLFPTDGTMSGDSSVGNLVKCEAPQRIFTACGRKAKAVMLLRNPVNRFVSNFLMRVNLGTHIIENSMETIGSELEAFHTEVMYADMTVQSYTEHWDRLLCLFSPAKNMVYEGLYYTHVMNWLCNFPLENVMIVNSEEFFASPTLILREVIDFLGLRELDEATLHSITSAVYNEGSYNVHSSLKISNTDRERLAELYERYNEPLLELLDWKGKVSWN